MRLLNTANFEIQEFRDDRIPRYAILSHTWDEAEIAFQDMQGAAVTEKKGYKKVEKCCSMARDRGHHYLWIDTCCIDKTSSAELSEAINSMYRWYQEAEVCYAYLADVLHDPGHRLSGLIGPEFSQSKWFRRGWTLQELIAPLGEVIFLDKEWKEIGTKSTLQDTVSSITGIPVDILTGNNDLESVSVAQRMSWAAERETTKTEDRAYSLMGIFGINMPLIYGEGKRAFIRLQEEIMKVLDDQSIFAWKSEEENHGGLLATSPGAFKESANIIPFNPFITSNSPLTISNRGIHLALRFMGIGRHGLGLAILHCAEIGKEDQLIAIYLRDLSLTMELFERVRCQDFEQLNLSDFRQSLYPMRGIYIRQRRLASFRASKVETNLHSNSKLPDRMQTTQMDATERASFLPTAQEGHNETANVRSARSDVETNFEAENGRTSLSHAAERGHYDEVKLLLARSDIQADSRDKYGRTPLSYAAGRGHVEVVWLLLQTGKVDAASNDGEGRTPLLHAVVGGYEEVVWLLLTRSDVQAEYKDGDGRTLLSHAARGGHEALIKLFLARSHTKAQLVDVKGRTPLSHAAEKGHEVVVKLLLTRTDIGPDSKDQEGRTPLSYAAQQGHETVVQQLLNKGADIESKNNSGRTPLSYAAGQGHEIMVQQLLDKGADIESKDDSSQTPLSYAAGQGHEIVVQQLLDKGADIESKDDPSWTPLSHAAQQGHETIVQQLLNKGADIESKNNFGRTPISYAAGQGHEIVVQQLLDKGADIESKDDSSQTPLSYAAQQGHEIVVQQLLDKGADIESKNSFNRTPLSYAAQQGHETIVQQLLNKGADTESKDIFNRTPLSYAAERGHKAVVKLLQSHSVQSSK